jgi:hypothetical protein
VIGKPTFVSANRVITALKKNCVNMKDTRSKVGKLHCIMDSTAHEEKKIAIVASTDPGELDLQEWKRRRPSCAFDKILSTKSTLGGRQKYRRGM